MKDIKQIKLFIACPGDIISERKSIQIIIEEINKTSGKQHSFSIEILHWDIDTYTQIGEDAQDVINLQIDEEYDILVGILWLKVGTPTKRDESGTIEEINRAISNNGKEQLIFFKTTPVPLNEIDINEFSKVNKYKEKLKADGVLFKEFSSPDKFESLFRINLTNIIIDKVLSSNETKVAERKSNLDEKYSDIRNIINRVEKKDEISIDILNLTDDFTQAAEEVSSIVGNITKTLEVLTDDLHKSTNSINKIKHIKDLHLKKSQTSKVANTLANRLTIFNENVILETPLLSNSLNRMSQSYAELLLASTYYNFGEDTDLKEQGLMFRDAIKSSVEGSASLLQEIMKWPPVNSNLNKKQRQTELVLKDLTKEMLDGLILLDQIIE